MAKTNARRAARLRRKRHIRKQVSGTASRPRLSVFRSAKHIYAQLVDDELGHTIASASSIVLGADCDGHNKTGARLVGAQLAKLALERDVKRVVFDRGGFLYHGRVAALADAAREAGLEF